MVLAREDGMGLEWRSRLKYSILGWVQTLKGEWASARVRVAEPDNDSLYDDDSLTTMKTTKATTKKKFGSERSAEDERTEGLAGL
jgi:hypothetical protein